MKHPFDLDNWHLETVDLDFLEPLSDEKTKPIDGSHVEVTTLALGEEGGEFPDLPWKVPKDDRPPFYPRPIEPPEATTMAIGEEGGGIIYF